MSDNLTKLVKDAKLENSQCVITNGRQRFICFTKLKDISSWMIAVTDGIDVWCQDLDEESLDAQRDLSGLSSIESFLSRFRTGFSPSDVSVGKVSTKVTLSVGKSSSAIEIDLFEAKAAEKKLELQALLFDLALTRGQLETQLASANQQIDNLKAQKAPSGGLSALADLSPKKGQGQAKPKVAKVGMSVVNPASRKRKVATGVVFGGD